MRELETSGFEKLKHLVPIGTAVIFLTGVILIAAAIIFGVSGMMSDELTRKEVASGAPELNITLKKELKILNNYEWVNKDSGTVIIPVQRAMELLVEESKDSLISYE